MFSDIGKKRGDAGVDCRDEEQVDDRAKLYPPRDSGRPKPHSESAIRETSDRRRVERNTIGRAKQHCKVSGKGGTTKRRYVQISAIVAASRGLKQAVGARREK